MGSSSLPAASLSALFSFPAGRLGRSFYNSLIYIILSSITWAVFGARSRFLPALREATVGGRSSCPPAALPAASAPAVAGNRSARQTPRLVADDDIPLPVDLPAVARKSGALRKDAPACRFIAKTGGPGGLMLSDELADAVVLGVADIDRAIGSDDGAVRPAETGRGGRTAVTLRALAASGDRLDDAACGIDAADRVVLGIDDQDVAAGVEGEFLGCVEHRIARRTIFVAVAATT